MEELTKRRIRLRKWRQRLILSHPWIRLCRRLKRASSRRSVSLSLSMILQLARLFVLAMKRIKILALNPNRVFLHLQMKLLKQPSVINLLNIMMRVLPHGEWTCKILKITTLLNLMSHSKIKIRIQDNIHLQKLSPRREHMMYRIN